MNFECKKTENCFADSQTYEYRLPITAEEFMNLLNESWQIRCNHRLRRPVFLAESSKVKIKGILSGTIVRVSFSNEDCENCKADFETFLKNL